VEECGGVWRSNDKKMKEPTHPAIRLEEWYEETF
jgi:hypothetical protein